MHMGLRDVFVCVFKMGHAIASNSATGFFFT